jgi:Txe/YoeB family toxin of Txe-Axe toxin-antitoxin module
VSAKARRSADPWRIHFFQRHEDDEAGRTVPALEFLDGLPVKVAAEIHAVLDAVAEAPPPSFSGGGKWEAMHADMAGYFEVRVQGGGQNHRLFCILERDAGDLGGSSIVCLGGLSKPRRTAANRRDYKLIKQYGAEFGRRRTVSD